MNREFESLCTSASQGGVWLLVWAQHNSRRGLACSGPQVQHFSLAISFKTFHLLYLLPKLFHFLGGKARTSLFAAVSVALSRSPDRTYLEEFYLWSCQANLTLEFLRFRFAVWLTLQLRLCQKWQLLLRGLFDSGLTAELYQIDYVTFCFTIIASYWPNISASFFLFFFFLVNVFFLFLRAQTF